MLIMSPSKFKNEKEKPTYLCLRKTDLISDNLYVHKVAGYLRLRHNSARPGVIANPAYEQRVLGIR